MIRIFDGHRGRALVIGALAGAVFGCSHIDRDQLATELEEVRQELRAERQAGDRELADRLGTVEGRLSTVEAGVEDNRARLERLQRDIEELQQQFDVTVRRLEGMIAFEMPVHFDYDSSELLDQHRPVLDRFARVVTEYYGDSLVTVEGFTDPAGSPEYNLRLGQRRAEEVKSYLVEVGGLDAESVRAVSYGEMPERQVRPGAHGPGTEGVENRRVALVIDYRGERPAATASAPGRPGGR